MHILVPLKNVRYTLPETKPSVQVPATVPGRTAWQFPAPTARFSGGLEGNYKVLFPRKIDWDHLLNLSLEQSLD